jgi:hypothetical protein
MTGRQLASTSVSDDLDSDRASVLTDEQREADAAEDRIRAECARNPWPAEEYTPLTFEQAAARLHECYESWHGRWAASKLLGICGHAAADTGFAHSAKELAEAAGVREEIERPLRRAWAALAVCRVHRPTVTFPRRMVTLDRSSSRSPVAPVPPAGWPSPKHLVGIAGQRGSRVLVRAARRSDTRHPTRVPVRQGFYAVVLLPGPPQSA